MRTKMFPKELAEEIKSKNQKSKKQKLMGTGFPEKISIFGKFIEHTGWYPDPNLRLFKRKENMSKRIVSMNLPKMIFFWESSTH